MTGGGEAVAFWLLAPVCVLGALTLLFARKAVYAALGMALAMVLLGVFYIVEKADFLGVVQIVVYTGAVMMLFLFVIMLVGVDSSDSMVETIKGQRPAALVFCVGLGGLLLSAIASVAFPTKDVQTGMDTLAGRNDTVGNITGMANLIFGKYVWVFELTSALLITAAISAMVLAHRQRIGIKPTQADWAAKRVRSNDNVAGLPAPGVYALHNAVDTPALLPDGTPSPLSVPRVLVARDQVTTPERYSEVEHDMEHEIEEGRAQ